MSKRHSYTIHGVLIVGAFLMIVPFIWMFLTTGKTLGESTQVPPVIFPSKFQWSNFEKVFTSFPFLHFYWNTIFMTVIRTFGQLVLCSIAAYAFARIKFPGRTTLFVLFLSVLMVPPQLFIIPQYLVMVHLGWLNSMKALIAPGIFSAFGTFLLRQFFLTLPVEIEEAAKIDGCNHFQIYWHIMLPQVKSGLIALAIFTIISSWNDFLWPLIVNNSPNKMPLSAGLASLQGEYATNYPVLMAGTFMAIIPMIIMFAVFQKHFVEGIALTGTKG
jgi:multiple sugar transport system permease protein